MEPAFLIDYRAGWMQPLTYLPERRLDLVQALPDFELSSQRGVTDAQLSLTI